MNKSDCENTFYDLKVDSVYSVLFSYVFKKKAVAAQCSHRRESLSLPSGHSEKKMFDSGRKKELQSSESKNGQFIRNVKPILWWLFPNFCVCIR